MREFTLIEVSFEAANKVGGIYTVLVSKMAYAMDNSSDYYAIGPYNEGSASAEFRQEKAPEELNAAFQEIQAKHGIRCLYGRWLAGNKPKTILVDPAGFREKTDEVKWKLWDEYGIDSWETDNWFNDPVIWSKCVGILLEELERRSFFKNQPVAHFHEWLSGAGLLHLNSCGAKMPTVFTTHSSVLGRAIAESGGEDLYGIINHGLSKGQTASDEKAYQYHTQAKHLMEKATAKNADVFTTVSDVMGKECEYILGRKPDVILPNGLDMGKFPGKDSIMRMHELCSENMRNFLLGYFLPYYEIDADSALVCFISGRYEFRNKGIDIFIEAMARLNETLKKTGQKREVFTFIWVPEATIRKKPTVVEHLDLFDDVEKLIENETDKIERSVLKAFIRGKTPKSKGVLGSEFLRRLGELGRRMKAMESKIPPICPFEMRNDNSITRALSEKHLSNRKADRVKVIYYPAYLSEKDGLLGMKYYNAMAACDVGVFPSYYESWGYTPLEAAALGLHSVTTDLSGYGKFIRPRLKKGETSISVLSRDGKPDSTVIGELHDLMLRIYKMGSEEDAAERERAKELSALADWGELFSNYMRAYGLALKS